MRVVVVVSLMLIALPIRAWDFCAPNQDGVLLYFNRIEGDEEACEVTYDTEALYENRTLRIPREVIMKGDAGKGIPDSVMYVVGIGDDAFCKTIASWFYRVELPYGVGYIGNRAFKGCECLEEVVWPENNEWFTTIGDEAFRESAIKYILIPKTTQEIGRYAFAGTMLETIDYEEGNKYLTYIPIGCYMGSFLKELRIPPFIKVISDNAFRNCPFLKPPHLYGVEIIGDYAFYGHPYWENFEIPSTVRQMGKYMFSAYDKSVERDQLFVKNLYVNAKTPPYCVSNKTFGDQGYDRLTKKFGETIGNVTVIVPHGTVNEYQTTYPWNRFAEYCFQSRDVSGVATVTVPRKDDGSCYDLNGRSIEAPRKGEVYVRDGKKMLAR